MKNTIIKCFILFHVVTIIIALTHLNNHFPKHKLFYPFQLAYTFYYKITLNNQKFPFFAPDVKTQLTLKIICKDTNNNEFEFFLPAPNSEIALRSTKVPFSFKEEKKREATINSLAKYIKLRHPEVRSIHMEIYEHDLPTMEATRRGAKESVKLFFQKTILV